MPRKKAERRFKFFPSEGEARKAWPYGQWMEDANFGNAIGEGPISPKWIAANIPPTVEEGTAPLDKENIGNGKPLPRWARWGELPDAYRFVQIWAKCQYFEDVFEKIWWCTPTQIRRHRKLISDYLEARGIDPLRKKDSKRFLFGDSAAQAQRNIARLFSQGMLTRSSPDDD